MFLSLVGLQTEVVKVKGFEGERGRIVLRVAHKGPMGHADVGEGGKRDPFERVKGVRSGRLSVAVYHISSIGIHHLDRSSSYNIW